MQTLLQYDETIETPGTNGAHAGFELRHRRDLLGRRLSRDVWRRVLRVVTLVVSDAGFTAVTLLLAGWLTDVGGMQSLAYLPWLGVLVLLGQVAAGGYGPIRKASRVDRVGLGLVYAGVGAAVSATTVGLGPVPVAWAAVVLPLLATMLLTSRAVLAGFTEWLYRKGFGVKNAIVVGTGAHALDIVRHFRDSNASEIRIIGHVSHDYGSDPTAMGPLEDLPRILERHDVREVIISDSLRDEMFSDLINECLAHGTRVDVVPGTLARIPARVHNRNVLGWPILELEVPRLHLLQLFLKRAVDIVGAVIGLLVLSPVFAATALVVRLEGKPVLFRQRRLAVGGGRFEILKFRSMHADAEVILKESPKLYEKYVENDYKLPEGEDPRVSRLGVFLRKTSLDELPQLLNVLKGDMSLVGPRPIVPQELTEYGDQAHTFLAVKPGITGWWQVNGRSNVGYPERAELDIEYITQWSLGLDLRILVLTLPRLMNGAH